MKRLLPILSAVGIVAAVALIYGVTVHFAPGNTKTAKAVACPKIGATHSISVHGEAITPEHTEALLCDKLVITNQDNMIRLMAFGLHDHHQPYDGVTEKALAQGQSLSVVLNQTGTFTFHDHLHDEVQGSFTVNN